MRTWGGRFSNNTDALTLQYTAGADSSLYAFDIAGSMAHARMLGHAGIISVEDSEKILTGLNSVSERIQKGDVEWRPEYEDIHTHIEVLLREEIGEVAGRLHTGRSRNDQVALLNRLLVRHLCDEVIVDLEELIGVFCSLASEHVNTVMPGYTHLQHAQPITLGHHLLAYGEMFLRDRDRFLDCRVRVNVLPLGSGALAGSPYPLNRQMVAEELGFEALSRNSLDATSDRDYAVEFVSAAALTQMHISRLAEEIILWSSTEFSFVRLPDSFATGSSMMPQKKNADVAELARGRAGRIYGELMALLTTLKGLPLAYNRDLQEDKPSILATGEVLIPTLRIFREMLKQLEFDNERMRDSAALGFTLATDVADYLVKKGVPFREAHQVVGGLVLLAEQKNCDLNELPFNTYQQAHVLFEEDVLEISIESALAERDLLGGTAPSQVREAVELLRNQLT